MNVKDYTVKNFKYIIKNICPPVIVKIVKKLRLQNTTTFNLKKHQCRGANNTAICFQRVNCSWNDAVKQTSGYSADNILDKCRDALLKVKNGEYSYERDSVLFSEREIFYPLLASLFYVASKNNNKLNLIDFGGSLGSTYFQNRDILKTAGISLNWNIVEQENFVKCGKEYFENEELHFFEKIDSMPISHKLITGILFSSVLQYLENPYNILDGFLDKNIKFLIIDRSIFLEDMNEDVLSIQNTPKIIYEASYPHWFLSLNKFIKYIEKYYDVIFKWNSLDQHQLEGYKTRGLGFFCVRK